MKICLGRQIFEEESEIRNNAFPVKFEIPNEIYLFGLLENRSSRYKYYRSNRY